MGIHLGLRDLCGCHVRNQPSVFLSESGLSTAFSCVGERPEKQEEWRSMRVLAEQLAELHQQERGVDKELGEARRKLSYLSDACKLLAELTTYPPSVLNQQAAVVPAADAAQWLKWWKDPQSWTAGYTYAQWLQDNAAGGDSARSSQATAPTGRAAGPRAPRLTGPRPANVTQAVVRRLQAQQITPQACEAAGAVVSALQAKLADIQQQQEEAFAQLSEGWRSVLQSAFTPQQEPLVLQLTISPDGPALQDMQQQLADSQAQLAAALQDVAAARTRAEAAEAALQQHQQAVLQQQQQKQELPPLQQEEAQPQPAAAAATSAVHGECSSVAEQPDTPAFRGLEEQQSALAPPLLASYVSPCSSSGSNNTLRTSSRVAGCSSDQSQDSAVADCHSNADQQQPISPQLAAAMGEAGDCSSAAAPDQQHQQDQQAPPAAAAAAAAAVPDQECSCKAWGQGDSVCTQSSSAEIPPPAAGGDTDSPTAQTTAGLRLQQQQQQQQQQQGQQPQQLLQEAQSWVAAERLAPLKRANSSGSVCSTAHSRCSHTSNSEAAVVGSSDLRPPHAPGKVQQAAAGSRSCSSGGGGGGQAARLAAPTAAAVPTRCTSFMETLAARWTQRVSAAAPSPAPPPVAAAEADRVGGAEAGGDGGTAATAFPGGAAAVGAALPASCPASAGAASAGTASAGAAVTDRADASIGSIIDSVRMSVIGPLSPEKVMTAWG